MITCKECGAKFDAVAKYCPECGASNEPDGEVYRYQGGKRTICYMPDGVYNDKLDYKGVAIFAYFGLFCLIPLLKAKGSPYARFHANQGIVLMIFQCITTAITFGMYTLSNYYSGIYHKTLDISTSNLANLCGIGAVLVFLVSFICWLVPFTGACKGVERKAPIVGNFKLLK